MHQSYETDAPEAPAIYLDPDSICVVHLVEVNDWNGSGYGVVVGVIVDFDCKIKHMRLTQPGNKLRAMYQIKVHSRTASEIASAGPKICIHRRKQYIAFSWAKQLHVFPTEVATVLHLSTCMHVCRYPFMYVCASSSIYVCMHMCVWLTCDSVVTSGMILPPVWLANYYICESLVSCVCYRPVNERRRKIMWLQHDLAKNSLNNSR